MGNLEHAPSCPSGGCHPRISITSMLPLLRDKIERYGWQAAAIAFRDLSKRQSEHIRWSSDPVSRDCVLRRPHAAIASRPLCPAIASCAPPCSNRAPRCPPSCRDRVLHWAPYPTITPFIRALKRVEGVRGAGVKTCQFHLGRVGLQSKGAQTRQFRPRRA